MGIKFYAECTVIFTAILIGLFFIIWQIKKKGLKKVSVDLIVYAEKSFKHNEDKFDYCVDQLIKIIPMPFSLFITDKMVEDIVQSTFDLIKKALDYREEN